MIWKFLTRAPYLNAPVSSLYFGNGDEHKQDLAFERESGSTVNQRDHVRFWDSGLRAPDGQVIWVGAASQDIGVEWNHEDYFTGPTHKISPHIDTERDQVAAELSAGGAKSLGMWQRGAFSSINGEGDPYSTDGGVAVFEAPLGLESLPLWKSFATGVKTGIKSLFPWL